MTIVELGGLPIHYRIDGPKDGMPVVFSNSLGTDFRSWDALMPHLPQDWRILRYDTRGHGLTGAPEGRYFMGDLVADAARLMDHTGFRGALFVGVSMGGQIAQGLAAERPDLVRGLVLMDTAARIGNEAMWSDRIAAIRAGGIASIADAILERWFTRAFRTGQATELAGWRHMLVRTPLDGYLGCCAAIADTDLVESTARLTLPTLAMAGAEDGSTPPDLVRETAALIPGSSFHVITGAGHLPAIEQPAAVAALLSGFAAGLP